MSTPKKFISENVKLLATIEKKHIELLKLIEEATTKANGGVWYFSGHMNNSYNIGKDQALEDAFSDYKSNLKDSYQYIMRRDAKNYLGSCKKSMQKITEIKPKK